MKVIKPISIDSANLPSSNIPEPDPSAGEVEYVPVDQGGGTIGDSFNYGPDLQGLGSVIGFGVDLQGNRYVTQSESNMSVSRLLIHRFDEDDNYIGYFRTNDAYFISIGVSVDIELDSQSSTDIFVCGYYESTSLTVDSYNVGSSSNFDGSTRSRTNRDGTLDDYISGDTGLVSYAHSKHTTGQWQDTLIYYRAGAEKRCITVRRGNFNYSKSLVSDNTLGAVSGDFYTCSIDIRSGKYLIFSKNAAGDKTYIQEYNSSFSSRTSINEVERLTENTQFGTYTGSEYIIGTGRNVSYSSFTGYKVKTNYQYGEVDPGEHVPAGSIFVKSSAHRKYQAAVDTLLDPLEGVLTVPPEWIDIGPTNRYSPFDGVLGNPATYQDEIDYVINSPLIINSVSGFNVYGANEITITQKDSSGNVVYQKDIPMRDNSQITDWYQYYFEPIIEINQFTVTDLLPYANSSIEVAIKGTGTVSVGELVIGSEAQIGETNYGSSLQLLDFSRKERDEFGNFDVIRRGTSKLVNYDVSIPKSRINYVFKTLSELSTIPCVWVGVDEFNDATTVYGYYKDSTLNIDAPTMCSATISVEGLV